MDHQLAKALRSQFVWFPTLNRGYFPVDPKTWPYDHQYFDKYTRYESQPIAKALNAFRVGIVEKHVGRSHLLDFGIGCGTFLKTRNNGDSGYDINPKAVAWLKERGKYKIPFGGCFRVVTFWDSLEHVDDIAELLEFVGEFAFISLPIFRDYDHALASKHFRPTEHYHYFTRDGFETMLAAEGFRVLEISDGETRAGREDILTFVAKRN